MNTIKDFSDKWADMMARHLDRQVLGVLIGYPLPRPLTKQEERRRKWKRFLSYLTRYQIVDTWTIHDGCDY